MSQGEDRPSGGAGAQSSEAAGGKNGSPELESVRCFLCGDDDAAVSLLPVRRRGRNEWVCVHCLPRLIHG